MKVLNQIKIVSVSLLVMLPIPGFSNETKLGDGLHLGVGFNTPGSIAAPKDAAYSVWFDINATHMFQLLGRYGMTLQKDWGAAILYKFAFYKTEYSSFYAGAGMGTNHEKDSTGFAEGERTTLLIGFRFSVPNLEHVVFGLEGGPIFDSNSGLRSDPSKLYNPVFSVSTALGLSVHYIF